MAMIAGTCSLGSIYNDGKDDSQIIDLQGCSDCVAGFADQFLLRSHLAVHFDSRSNHLKTKEVISQGDSIANELSEQHYCGICDQIFPPLDIMKTHLNHVLGSYQQLGTAIKQNDSVQSITDIKYSCLVCQNNFDDLHMLRIHICGKQRESNREEQEKYSCLVCHKNMTDLAMLQTHHCLLSVEKKPYACSVCDKSFSFSVDLKKHALKCLAKRFLCNICGDKYETMEYLLDHMKRHAGNSHQNCPDCYEVFYCEKDLQIHLKSHEQILNQRVNDYHPTEISAKAGRSCRTGNSEFQNHGKELFKYSDTLNEKSSLRCRPPKSDENKYENENAAGTFSGVDDVYNADTDDGEYHFDDNPIKEEEDVISEEETNQMNETDFPKGTTKDVDQAKIEHALNERKMFIREISKAQAINDPKGSALMILKYLEKERLQKGSIHSCHICYKAFKLRSTLIEHVNNHQGDLPFSCKYCKRKFKTEFKLKKHLEVKPAEKQYGCCGSGKLYTCDFCHSQYSSKTHCSYHIKRHYDPNTTLYPKFPPEAIGSWETCMTVSTRKSFTTEITTVKAQPLDISFRLTDDKGQFFCPICDKKYTRKDILINHLCRHGEVKPWMCDLCLGRFSNRSNCYEHVRKHYREGTSTLPKVPMKEFNTWKDHVIMTGYLPEELENSDDNDSLHISICSNSSPSEPIMNLNTFIEWESDVKTESTEKVDGLVDGSDALSSDNPEADSFNEGVLNDNYQEEVIGNMFKDILPNGEDVDIFSGFEKDSEAHSETEGHARPSQLRFKPPVSVNNEMTASEGQNHALGEMGHSCFTPDLQTELEDFKVADQQFINNTGTVPALEIIRNVPFMLAGGFTTQNEAHNLERVETPCESHQSSTCAAPSRVLSQTGHSTKDGSDQPRKDALRNHSTVNKKYNTKSYGSELTNKRYKCLFCHQRFTRGFTLRRHVQKFHRSPEGENIPSSNPGKDNRLEENEGTVVFFSDDHTHITDSSSKDVSKLDDALSEAEEDKGNSSNDTIVTGQVLGRSTSLDMKKNRQASGPDKRFKCSVCHVKFTRSFTLRRHVQKFHPEHYVASAYKRPQGRKKKRRAFNNSASDSEDDEGLARSEITPNEKECDEIPENKPRADEEMETLGNSCENPGSKKNFDCILCDKTYTRRSSLSQHVKSTHSVCERYSCNECSLTFNRRSTLVRHKVLHQRTFVCPICDRAKVSQRDLDKHMATHREEKAFECEACGKKFKVEDCMKRHFHTMHGSGEYSKKHICEFCGKVFPRNIQLKYHLENHAAVGVSCKFCGKTYGGEIRLKVHIKNCHEERIKKYMCEKCGKAFREKKALKVHMRSHDDRRPFECDICKKTFKTLTSIHWHQDEHDEGPKPFTCDKCGRSFGIERKYKHHVKYSHSGLTFSCDTCPKFYTSKSSLTTHIREVHTASKKFSCSLCGKLFRGKGRLRNHTKSCLRTNSLGCSICQAVFLEKQLWVQHMDEHRGRERKHACTMCERRFSLPSTLKRHYKLMHYKGQNNNTCEHCQKSFHFLRDLEKHLKTHSFERKYGCEFCHRRFVRKAHLDRHISTAHTPGKGVESSGD